MDYITQEEYLIALAEELKYLNPKDATKVLQFYQNKINNALDYGEKEEDIIASLPRPSEVAKGAYESHNINYLEIRKRKYKRKQIINKIIDSIISIVVLISFFVVMYFIISSITKMFSLTFKIFEYKKGLDILFTSLGVIPYAFVIILLSIYVIDLFIIILSHFLNNVIKLKNENLQTKIFTFTITGYIEEKTNHKKIQIKTIIALACVSLIFMTTSFLTKGYVYNSLNDIPTNTLKIDLQQELTSLNINASNANIYIKNTQESTPYLEYIYELDNKLGLTYNNKDVTLLIKDTIKYDVLGILNEPTQNIIIYLPSTLTPSIKLNFNNGVFDATELALNDINITANQKGTISFVNTNVNSINIEGYNVAFAVHNSNVQTITHKTNKGQFIIEKESNIQNLNIENYQTQLRFTDSYVENTTLTNAQGTIDFINMKGNIINYQAKSSLNTFTDCTFKEMNFDISTTCSLTFTRLIADKVSAKSNGSFIIIDYIKVKETSIDATASNVFVTGLGKNYPESTEYAYNDSSIDSNLIIKNKADNSKTEIVDSNIKETSITQDQGFLMFKNSYVENGTLNIAGCNMVELIDLDGIKLDLYLSKIETSITIDSSILRNLVYNVKEWDLISSANMIKNNDTIKFQVEGEN